MKKVDAKAHSSTSLKHFEADKVVDTNLSTFWSARDDTFPQWIRIDLGEVYSITGVKQIFKDSDIWKFCIEGSCDNEKWVMLLDKSTGEQGHDFTYEVKYECRYIRLTVIGAAKGNPATSCQFKAEGNFEYEEGLPVKAKWWEEQSGVIRYYVKLYNISLKSIESQLDMLKEQGYEIIELMCPYEGPNDVWAGLGATNNYNIDPSIGTMEDLKDLLEKCHIRGMKVIFFGNVGYARDTAPFFIKACDDYRNNVYSKESMWFHFNTEGGERWYWSDRAGAYFYAYWGSNIPSYNFANQEWREECKKYLQFWAETGIDGIGLDAPEVYDGISTDISKEYITDVLNSYDIWTNSEGARAPEWISDWEFKCIQDYSLVDWGANPRSETLKAIKEQNPSALNDILKKYRDVMNALGGTTITPPGWECEATIPERLLEIAFLVSIGTMFTLHSGDMTFVGQDIIDTWSDEEREKVFRLIKAQNSYKALTPSGLRVTLPTNDDNKYFAFIRTNKEGDVKALVILNFQNSLQDITVDLSNAGIELKQVPVDLVNGTVVHGTKVPEITSSKYTVTLSAYGYLMLGVK